MIGSEYASKGSGFNNTYLLLVSSSQLKISMLRPLREKCPSIEFTWSVFMPSTGKYGPQKSLYLDTFHAVVKELYATLKYGWLCLKQAIGVEHIWSRAFTVIAINAIMKSYWK